MERAAEPSRGATLGELPILTTELTCQIERQFFPAADSPGVRLFGKTLAKRVAGPWPPSAVYGFNGDDVGRLPEILSFFGDKPPVFYLSHAGFTPELAGALREAGYAPRDWNQTILYGLPLADALPSPPNISVERVTAASLEAAAEVAARGNGWAKEWRENAQRGFCSSLGRPGFHLYLARLDGEPAGVADLSVAANGWGMLGGAAVVPEFRNRGLHACLIQFRLRELHELGCPLVVGAANFDSASFRNQQRLGLRLAYVEAAWARRGG